MPLWLLMCLFLHCHPVLNPTQKTHFPYFLRVRDPPPPRITAAKSKILAFFMGLQKQGVYDTC